MIQTEMTDELERAEGLMLQGQPERAAELLARLAEDAEEYVDKNCPTTDEVQWFSFPTLFERLAYRRVEKDPRELRDVGEPLDRLYGDLALANVHAGDYDAAMSALKSAIRWNPMDCGSRLNLADLYRVAGDMQEYLALTYSVFERASDARHLARAFVNFSGWFQASEKPRTAAAALRAARALDVRDSSVDAALDQAAGTERDPDLVSDDEVEALLAEEGLPDGANADIAVCLLMCASDAAAAGARDVAANLTLRARDLVGEAAAKALLELIRESDAVEGDADGEE
ncbi:tetratricopeptide repeat protein [Thermophilibacter sp. ZX-H3]|uniref:tetratricopeptide repeat protein n=1 Tax=unclassified Thermophilibacter TaxID=2847308 RepID=UPI0040409CAC